MPALSKEGTLRAESFLGQARSAPDGGAVPRLLRQVCDRRRRQGAVAALEQDMSVGALCGRQMS